MSGPAFRIAVVIPTLGVEPGIARLLESLAAQRLAPAQTVIVNQGPISPLREIVAASPLSRVAIVECDKGLSRARNAGMRRVVHEADAIAFPDDDVWYAPDALERAAKQLAESRGIVCGRLDYVDGRAPRLAFGDAPARLAPATVWRSSIEAGYVIHSRLFDLIGGFAEDLGLGARTPWGSGEGTDLLLRAIRAGIAVDYLPGVRLFEEGDPDRVSDTEPRARLRSYARGTGQVFRRREGLAAQVRLAIRSAGRLAVSLLRADQTRVGDAREILRGRLEGMWSADARRSATAARRRSSSAPALGPDRGSRTPGPDRGGL